MLFWEPTIFGEKKMAYFRSISSIFLAWSSACFVQSDVQMGSFGCLELILVGGEQIYYDATNRV